MGPSYSPSLGLHNTSYRPGSQMDRHKKTRPSRPYNLEPMNRLDRYILAEILGPLGLGFFVFTFILLLQALFKSAKLIISSGVAVGMVGKLLAPVAAVDRRDDDPHGAAFRHPDRCRPTLDGQRVGGDSICRRCQPLLALPADRLTLRGS